jgi:hypothetical protein
MSDEKEPEKVKGTDTSAIPWIQPEDGICEVYANVVHVNWSAYDVRIRLGRLVTVESATGAKWAVNEEAGVSMAYGQAKYLRNLLHGIIKDYEAKNGEINMNPIWPAPTAPLEPT